MWAIIAAMLFGIAFVIHGGAFATSSAWLAWQSFALLGLAALALHMIPLRWPRSGGNG